MFLSFGEAQGLGPRSSLLAMEEKATVAAEPLMLVWARGLTGKSHELPAVPPIIDAQYELPFRDMTSRGLDSVYELEGGYAGWEIRGSLFVRMDSDFGKLWTARSRLYRGRFLQPSNY